MARTLQTARKNTDARASPQSLVDAYYEHQRIKGEVLVEFFVHFGILWNRVHRHGVTDYDGIVRLISHLPRLWKEWVEATAKLFLWRRLPVCDLEGSMNGFLKAMISGLIDHRDGPPPTFSVAPPPAILELPLWTFLKRRGRGWDEGESSRPSMGKKARTETEDMDDSDEEEEAEDYHSEAEEETELHPFEADYDDGDYHVEDEAEDHHTEDAEEEESYKVGEPQIETHELGETEFVPTPPVGSPPEIPPLLRSQHVTIMCVYLDISQQRERLEINQSIV